MNLPAPDMGPSLLDADQTASVLPYGPLAMEIERLLLDDSVCVSKRLVLPLPGGASLLVMPAHDSRIAITKLITYTPANIGTGRATIQGDVVVFDIATGERMLMLDGPTVTARRTAAVSLLAAQRLAAQPRGPLLIVGAGVQGRAHLQAFAEGLGIQRVVIASRGGEGARVLAQFAVSLGVQAQLTDNPNEALGDCPLAVTCTPAQGVVLDTAPRPETFVCAVGAFTPSMVELSAPMCRHFAEHGSVVVDTVDAAHEAGDLLQAGLDVTRLETLAMVVRAARDRRVGGPVLFKSCGSAAWDLAAARLAMRSRKPG